MDSSAKRPRNDALQPQLSIDGARLVAEFRKEECLQDVLMPVIRSKDLNCLLVCMSTAD